MNAPFQISRRSFLKRCSVIAAATGLPLWFVQREMQADEPVKRPIGPNDRPRVGLIGCGGMGQGDAQNSTRFCDVVAVCDVDQSHVNSAVKRFTKEGKAPAAYTDFRKLLENKEVDAVIQATPDHWHTLINMAAAKAGKDVYGESLSRSRLMKVGTSSRPCEIARSYSKPGLNSAAAFVSASLANSSETGVSES